MALSSFNAMASAFPVPFYAAPARMQAAVANMNTDTLHPARGASGEDVQSQLRKRVDSYALS